MSTVSGFVSSHFCVPRASPPKQIKKKSRSTLCRHLFPPDILLLSRLRVAIRTRNGFRTRWSHLLHWRFSFSLKKTNIFFPVKMAISRRGMPNYSRPSTTTRKYKKSKNTLYVNLQGDRLIFTSDRVGFFFCWKIFVPHRNSLSEFVVDITSRQSLVYINPIRRTSPKSISKLVLSGKARRVQEILYCKVLMNASRTKIFPSGKTIRKEKQTIKCRAQDSESFRPTFII